ncbi:hypothetical protein [Nonomuraea sp. NPDC050310]|uniref:hypothetical protein n=1 Tax=unclassified Nonomuraea TaxID=2593643 RepID=UPI0033D237E0
MDAVEPLQMPPMVLHSGEVPAFLLAWRRSTAAGWEGRLAIPRPGTAVEYLWAPAAQLTRLRSADYSAVPRDEERPLRLPPMVLSRGDNPAFLLAWRPFTADGRQGWDGHLAIPPRLAGVAARITLIWVSASGIRRLPEVDYSFVPRLLPAAGGVLKSA